jgi:hypothetical protein
MTRQGRFACPCCGYVTITTEYDICHICRWEHDLVQESEPDSTVGANGGVSLRRAQRNFAAYGACEEPGVPYAGKPSPDDVRDPKWKPVDEWDREEWRKLYDELLGRERY